MANIIKIALTLVLIIIFAIGLIYFNLGVFLEWAAGKALDYIALDMAKEGLQITDYRIDKVGVKAFPISIIMRDFSAYFAITQKNVFQIETNFFLTVKNVILSVENLDTKSMAFTLKDAVITMRPAMIGGSAIGGKNKERDRLEISMLKIPFQLDFKDRREAIKQAELQAKAIFREFGKLAKEGTISLPVEFSGSCSFVVKDTLLAGKLFLVPFDKGYKLVMDIDDFRIIALKLKEDLAKAEFVSYASNPLRLPRLLRIRDYARDSASSMSGDYTNFQQDAYKHILWAYLLAKEYGDGFSEEITGAHEKIFTAKEDEAFEQYLKGLSKREGLTDDSVESLAGYNRSEADRQKDIANMVIGREYAKLGYSESGLVRRMLSDGRVIYDNSDVSIGR